MHFLKLYENFETTETIKSFVEGKELKIKSSKIKGFLFHGTSKNPNEFALTYDYDGDSGNTFHCDLPEGVIFLTNDIKEANCYGYYVIPCEIKAKRVKVFKINSERPSIAFDDDFCGYGNLGMFTKFVEGGYDVLEVRGTNKSTFITYPENILPRTDLAIEYYANKKASN